LYEYTETTEAGCLGSLEYIMNENDYLSELARIHAQLEELVRQVPLGTSTHQWTRGKVCALVDTGTSCLWGAICSLRAEAAHREKQESGDET